MLRWKDTKGSLMRYESTFFSLRNILLSSNDELLHESATNAKCSYQMMLLPRIQHERGSIYAAATIKAKFLRTSLAPPPP